MLDRRTWRSVFGVEPSTITLQCIKIVPKEKKVQEISKKLELANKELAHKKAEVQDNLEKMQRECDETMEKKENLRQDIERTQQRLARAGKLTELLADEGVRWQEQLIILNTEYENLVGNVFLQR